MLFLRARPRGSLVSKTSGSSGFKGSWAVQIPKALFWQSPMLEPSCGKTKPFFSTGPPACIVYMFWRNTYTYIFWFEGNLPHVKNTLVHIKTTGQCSESKQTTIDYMNRRQNKRHHETLDAFLPTQQQQLILQNPNSPTSPSNLAPWLCQLQHCTP